MTWTLAQAKTELGIVDGSKDAALTRTMSFVQKAIETALQRPILEARATEIHRSVITPTLTLDRYPISTIHTVNGLAPTVQLVIDTSSGVVTTRDGWASQDVTFDYTAGYATDEIPDDLEFVMWAAFYKTWNDYVSQTTGYPADEESGATMAGTGDVKKVNVHGAFSMDYDVGGSAAEAMMDARAAARWGWLYPWAPMLEPYRSTCGVGMGIM